MKKFLIVLPLGILIMFFSGHNVYAAFDLSVTSATGAPGSTVSISVVGDFSKPVHSVQFNMQYDPSLLTPSSITIGPDDSSWTMFSNSGTSGQLSLDMLGMNGSVVSGSGKQIAVISFKVNNPTGSSSISSSLTLSNVNFDSTNITSLTAGNFSLNVSYVLTVNVSGNGTVSESPNTPNYPSGSQVQLTANPSAGYQFSSWSADANGTTNPLTLTMNSNMNVIANFTANVAVPVISAQPTSQTVNASSPATFMVVAGGTPSPSYQWQQSTDGSTWTNIDGANSNSLTIPAVSVSNNGTQYICVVTNSSGTTTSSPATLTVNPVSAAPGITVEPMSQTVTAPDTAVFTVIATGTPTPTYQWQQSTDSGNTWETINNATSASYTTDPTNIKMNGTQYECVITNTLGSVTSDVVTLSVES